MNGARTVTVYNHSSLVEAIGAPASDKISITAATDFIELWAISVAGVNTVDVAGNEAITKIAIQKIS